MKKVLIIGALLAGGFFLFGPKKDDAGGSETVENNGFRELTDAEAQNYLNQNIDLAQAYKGDLEQAKWHWRIQGWVNERDARPNPYLS